MKTTESLPPGKVATQHRGHKDAAPRSRRLVPDMRVVTKGWWTLKEERAPAEALEQEDRDDQRSA